MKTDTKRRYVRWIVENLSEFEFNTPEAQMLKQDLRSWYYGEQGSGEAEQLMQRFNNLFTFNLFTGVVCEPIWAAAEQSIIARSPDLTQGLSLIPRGSVVGRSIRIYSGVDGVMRDDGSLPQQFERMQNDTAQQVMPALRALEVSCQQESLWYKTFGMSGRALVTAVMGLLVMTFGFVYLVSLLFPILLDGAGFDSLVEGRAVYQDAGLEITLVLMVICLACTLVLAFLTPRMIMTVRAGLMWVCFQKSRFSQRQKMVARIRTSLERGAFRNYGAGILQAAQQCVSLPPDAPYSSDPSRALLGREGFRRAFSSVCAEALPPYRSITEFCMKLTRRHLESRGQVIWTSVIFLIAWAILDAGNILAGLL